MKHSLLTLISLFLWWSSFHTPFAQAQNPGFNWSKAELLAIQDRGRVKPLDTFCQEAVYFITGKTHFFGMSAPELVFEWLFHFEQGWVDKKMIHIDHKALKTRLNLNPDEKYFSLNTLANHPDLGKWVGEVARKQQSQENLEDIEKKVLNIQTQMGYLRSISQGSILYILPHPEGKDKAWFPLSVLSSEQELELPYSALEREKLHTVVTQWSQSFVARDAATWNKATEELHTVLASLGGESYPSLSSLQLERHYNHFRPFRVAWIVYLLAFILLVLAFIMEAPRFKKAGGLIVLLGFIIQTYGFVIRAMISERPPVTNMYESVIWVSWGCILFAGIIYWAYKKYVILTSATVFAFVSLVLADNLPSVLDPGINPLEPVLRSNFWLTIHVLTITLSYAAFALSLCLGNVVMGFYIFKPTEVEKQQYLTLYMYRAIQIGVVLLSAGTILGGVWADYSWGRFWGWDPKEVWALIALLLYLAVMHGRFTGWLSAFGFVTATIFCFLGVLMAWYGVNFVLGAGLHSYGFGSGGLGYVSTYVALQLGFVVAGYLQLKKHGSTKKSTIFPKGIKR